MTVDPRWDESNQAHVLTFKFFKQIYNDTKETILAENGKLKTLNYYNAAAPAGSNDNDMRAFDAAAKLVNFAYVRGIDFETGKSKESAFSGFNDILKNGENDIIMVAEAVDAQYRFSNEEGFS